VGLVLHYDAVAAARTYLSGRILRTPTVASPAAGRLVGRPTYLKLEGLQLGGSFKWRGVAWRFAQLSPAERARGVVAMSGGNFGLAIAEVAGPSRIAATLVLPESTPPASIERIRAAGATAVVVDTVETALATVDELAASTGALALDDMSDAAIAAGYGTLAMEMLEDVPALTDIVVAVGGGALLAGVCAAVADRVRVWGGEPTGSPCLVEALAAGRPLATAVTTRISTLGVPSVSPLILDSVRGRTAGVVLIPDEDSYAATRRLIEDAKVWSEPAAGCALAAAQRIAPGRPADAVVGVVACGANATLTDVFATTSPK
jgi:threonine dehydratase